MPHYGYMDSTELKIKRCPTGGFFLTTEDECNGVVGWFQTIRECRLERGDDPNPPKVKPSFVAQVG